MKYTIINEKTRAHGTSFKLAVNATYDDLVNLFGTPLKGSDDGKIQAQWVLETEEGTIVTLYDYKSNKFAHSTTEWHIGAKTRKPAEDLIDYINEGLVERFTCVLCGDPSYGFGNNPAPLAFTGKCCDTCNDTKVIQARLANLK